MASIQVRVSRGKKYWSIVESRRINGQPRTVILEYLGTASSLLLRLRSGSSFAVRSYSHGDSAALINAAIELDIVSIINKHIPQNRKMTKPTRDGLTVGASLLLAAVGRACHPTSKLGWYDWCQGTSLEYCLKRQFKDLDSQHFWDQMNALPVNTIAAIEDEIVKKLVQIYGIKLDCLFFDTTNFFTFIDSSNTRCDLPQRGRNKQHRYDLRQIGMALLVSRNDHFPLFHQTYRGNKNDGTLFKEVFSALVSRLRMISSEISKVTIVFDKGNNTKANFKLIDAEDGLYYVGGLVSSYFRDLILEANSKFEIIEINGEPIPIYRIKRLVWGKERTCLVTISKQLLEGQIKGIEQSLEKKFKLLEKLKRQLENYKSRSTYDKKSLTLKIKKIIHGQFVEDILKFEIFVLDTGKISFSYFVSNDAFDKLKKEILGRKILVSNRHEWTPKEIIIAYRGQSNVEFAFKDMKNPYHLAIRPQFHWTDQKIEAHFFICMIAFLLVVCVYSRAKNMCGYSHSMNQFMEDLNRVRLTSIRKKSSNKINYQLENIPKHLELILPALKISQENLRHKLNFSDYT